MFASLTDLHRAVFITEASLYYRWITKFQKLALPFPVTGIFTVICTNITYSLYLHVLLCLMFRLLEFTLSCFCYWKT